MTGNMLSIAFVPALRRWCVAFGEAPMELFTPSGPRTFFNSRRELLAAADEMRICPEGERDLR